MNRRQLIARATAAIGAAALCTGAAAAADPTAADLQTDVQIVRRALALHPGLYRYSTPAEVEARLVELERAYPAAQTLAARYLVLSRFLATIRCGHTYGNFFNQTAAVAKDLFDRRTRLPFHFAWLEGRMVVTADPSKLGVPRGAEVVSVNDLSASDLLKALMPYARADGHNDAKRMSLLGVSGADAIETFDVFHGLQFGPPSGGRHRLMLRPVGGGEMRLELPAFGLAERQSQMIQRDRPGGGPVWDWGVRRDGVAVLTMPSWAVFNSQWDWRTWLDQHLNALTPGQGLIIDLRVNEGGLDCGDEILARLTSAPIPAAIEERRVRFQRTPADLDPYLETWDNRFRTLGVDAAPMADGFFRLSGAPSETVTLPRGPRLEGRVAALIGPANSSATFQFAARAQASGLVRLFGEPTGGNQRGINGGGFFFVRLPASGIEFDLPLIGYYPLGRPADAGLTPDVIVKRTATDVANGDDRALEAAARWVAG